MSQYRPSHFNSIAPVVKNLIAINIILWLASILFPDILNRFGFNMDIKQILGMHYWESNAFKYYQLITYMFLHADIQHIFFNMFSLYMFGTMLENVWGSKRFLLYYMVTGIGAGLIQQLFWTIEFGSTMDAFNNAIATNNGRLLEDCLTTIDNYLRIDDFSMLTRPDLIELKKLLIGLPITIGASGAVFGLLLAYGWSFPETSMYIMFIPIPIKAKVLVFVYGALELFFGVAQFSGDNIAHFAHLGGMLFGAILLFYWKKKHIF